MRISSIKTTIACLAVATLVCGCGKQHEAESVVKDFLETNLQASDYTVSFSGIDSTRHVTDSVVNKMRADAANSKMFKRGIKYAGTDQQYIYTKVKICIGGDTTSHTFYLDPKVSQVVAFKDN